MPSSVATQVVGFLDTNVFHYVSLYLQFATNHRLFPLGPEAQESTGSLAEATERIKQQEEKQYAQSLQKGFGVIYRVLNQDIQVRYAPVSELELIAGRLRGRAIIKAAEEGLPDRMWTKFDEEEIRKRLITEDNTEITAQIGDIVSTLMRAGLMIIPADNRDARYVLEVTKFLAGLVYLQPMDAIIYSAALVAQAREFYTADGFLRRTVNRIGNPHQSSEDKEISAQVRQRVATLMGWKANDVILPTASKLKSFLPDTDRGSGWHGPTA